METVTTIVLPIAMAIMGGIFVVLWWLIRARDAKRDKEIQTLWDKHDEDAKRLQELELEIAKRHYMKDELDMKFKDLENTFREGIKDLTTQLQAFTTAILRGKMNHD